MPYIIQNSDNTQLTVIADGTEDNTTSLALFGKNFNGYGLLMNENFVKLLQNFSSATAPINPIEGQLWWNRAINELNVYDGANWRPTSSPHISSTTPTFGYTGELWWDAIKKQLNVYTGSSWQLIAPAYSEAQGKSGQVTTTILDIANIAHTVVEFYVSDILVAILSKDVAFNTTAVFGFTTISPGLNIANTGSVVNGTATNSAALGGIAASNYLRGDAAYSSHAPLTILDQGGITVGPNSEFTVGTSGSTVELVSNLSGRDVGMFVQTLGVKSQALTISAANSQVSVKMDPVTQLGVATKRYVDNQISLTDNSHLRINGSSVMHGDIIPSVSGNTGTYSLGSPANNFFALYSTISVIQRSEIVVNYAADTIYPAGTVLDFGGSQEVTLSSNVNTTKVAGVVSASPGITINSHLSSSFVTPIVVSGRCFVNVVGTINKGDLLVSAGNGYASVAPITVKPGMVIGKAITAFSGLTGAVEMAVGLC
jgi:hypothetical protein